MKKLLLTLGSAAAVAAPMATVVACNEPVYTNLITMDFEGTTIITEDIEDIIDGILVDEDGGALTDTTNVSIDLSLEEDESAGAYYIMSFDDFTGVDVHYGTILFDITNLPPMMIEDPADEDKEIDNPAYATAIANIVAAVQSYI